MSMKYLPLVGALAIAGPAFGITVNMTDFTYTPPSVVTVNDANNAANNYGGVAGQFSGAMGSAAGSAARSASATAGASFTAYCVELSQNFAFGVTYDYTMVSGVSYFGADKASDLSRLFFAAQGFVVDGITSAALQAAIWEVVYETGASYDLGSGSFTGSGNAGAFATVNSFLENLDSYSDAYYQLGVLVNAQRQNFVVPTPVPEPGTWALMAAGLGALGFMARRRKA
jgi:PEP-CTERM motif